jgi:AcrR family transcriptional regulator
VFAREGYRDSNLSLIAQECGISRPTIYQYFKDKEEIYYYAVKLVTGRMFTKFALFAWDTPDNFIDRINLICNDIMDTASAHEGELTSLVDVMLQMKKEGRDFNAIVLRRTAKLTILFKRLLRAGIKEGDIVQCDINKVADHILLLLESCCFQVAFLDTFDMVLSKELINNYLEFFKTSPKGNLVLSRS